MHVKDAKMSNSSNLLSLFCRRGSPSADTSSCAGKPTSWTSGGRAPKGPGFWHRLSARMRGHGAGGANQTAVIRPFGKPALEPGARSFSEISTKTLYDLTEAEAEEDNGPAYGAAFPGPSEARSCRPSMTDIPRAVPLEGPGGPFYEPRRSGNNNGKPGNLLQELNAALTSRVPFVGLPSVVEDERPPPPLASAPAVVVLDAPPRTPYGCHAESLGPPNLSDDGCPMPPPPGSCRNRLDSRPISPNPTWLQGRKCCQMEDESVALLTDGGRRPSSRSLGISSENGGRQARGMAQVAPESPLTDPTEWEPWPEKIGLGPPCRAVVRAQEAEEATTITPPSPFRDSASSCGSELATPLSDSVPYFPSPPSYAAMLLKDYTQSSSSL
uniref:Metabotropic glutamate receptor Homer-binding domain-containing protein n=1 Tax=Eptatretus burgeri TaxID=7764 RepID=A0A8C4QMN4_EPTBU